MIDLVKFSTNPATGVNGAASAMGYSPPVSGQVLAVHLEYLDSPPASTYFSLKDENDPSGESILVLDEHNVNVKHYPRRAVQDASGLDRTYDGSLVVTDKYVVHGRLKAEIMTANPGDSIEVSVWIET